MSNEDWRDGFQKGFEAGRKSKEAEVNPYDISKWKQAPFPTTPTIPPLYAKEHCPKCGISIGGVMGYVCHSPNCPTFPQTTCDVSKPLTASAVGTMQSREQGYNIQKEGYTYGSRKIGADGGISEGLESHRFK